MQRKRSNTRITGNGARDTGRIRALPVAAARTRPEAAGLDPHAGVRPDTGSSCRSDRIGAAQAYPDWELRIVDDASTNQAIAVRLASAAARDPRIHVVRRANNGGIAAATNDALASARGEYCAFLDHDDTLAPDALLAMIEAAASRPDVALMFSDEDKLDPSGRRTAPFFKPAWDDEWIRTTNCVLHLTVVRTDLLRQLGGIATGVDGAQDWDLVLRLREQAGPSRIAHVPRVLYHWREGKGSTAAAAFEKPALVQAQADVLARSLLRRGDDADAVVTDRGWRIVYRSPSPPPLVSVVIPSRDRADLLRACITSLRDRTTYPALEIIVVDNDSRDADALAYLRQLESCRAARVIEFPHAFNYAAQCNVGVRGARGTMIALVNNDIEAIGDGWLRELCAWHRASASDLPARPSSTLTARCSTLASYSGSMASLTAPGSARRAASPGPTTARTRCVKSAR